ncbi:MBL fold metallo-hydrolase [Streptomonospora salina]|uniref:Ribonuclease BN (tRNA processing enzyme) n=1 Tax=Streptomonospora salina TaxID=104205 RepID=A0A841E4Y9_9ACTN|nr:MBL fold metallo-hydrolase [Streptomonospora salina]MBB5998927.1 ribonuclease BN (tRNA processing enzyme) [Streptomonospora salina]
MELTVLGSAAPYARPGNPCSGYLVTGGSGAVWLDAGPGTLAQLQRHTRLPELDGIWISHLHADHCADLLTAFYALVYADQPPQAPIPLYGPPGTADRLEGFLSNAGRSPLERAFDVRELHDGHRARLGGMQLESRSVEHGMPGYAVRIHDGARSLAYSGDSAPCAALDAVARDADLLLCEADGDPPEDGQRVHHSPEDAGRTAARAGAHRLVVTHVGPFLRTEEALRRAAAEYPGPVGHADPGKVVSVD